jgi:large subunit ribosomal protein L15
MRLHDLRPAPGSHKDRKRLGRGNASGTGTTAGKGTKGEKARSGGVKAGFRGMSSRNQRLAKRRGFNNIFKVEYEVVNVSKLSRFDAEATVDITGLEGAGLISGKTLNIKILGDGELEKAIHLDGLKVSSSARKKIEAAGGSIKLDEPEPKAKPSKASSKPPEPEPEETLLVAEVATTEGAVAEPEEKTAAPKRRRSTAKKKAAPDTQASDHNELDNTSAAETETPSVQETTGDTGSA